MSSSPNPRKRARTGAYPTTPSASSSRAATPSNNPTKTCRKAITTPRLSLLESLPTELLQLVFIESLNISLPLCSHHLAHHLSSPYCLSAFALHHLHDQPFTHQVPIRSLLPSRRFFNLAFVKALKIAAANRIPPVYEPYLFGRLRVPSKVLHGPWTASKIELLRFFDTECPERWTDELGKEVARQGAVDAVREGNAEMLQLLYSVARVTGNIEQLWAALTDSEYKQDVVDWVVGSAFSFSTGEHNIDTLDPRLWAWIQHCEALGGEDAKNAKGLKLVLQKPGLAMER
ncbi:hypothetical protein LTS18_011821, partial [Coniosporium uncinatum]